MARSDRLPAPRISALSSYDLTNVFLILCDLSEISHIIQCDLAEKYKMIFPPVFKTLVL